MYYDCGERPDFTTQLAMPPSKKLRLVTVKNILPAFWKNTKEIIAFFILCLRFAL
jgi:hypothetical protein